MGETAAIIAVCVLALVYGLIGIYNLFFKDKYEDKTDRNDTDR